MTTRDSVDIPLSSALGELLVRVLGGPADQVGGIAEDWLHDKRRMIRRERAERLARETDEALRARGVDGPTRRVPLNVALRIVEEATLEDDDFLQDHWARLLATAMDSSAPPVERAFVGILRDFAPSDAKLLAYVHQATCQKDAPIGPPHRLGDGSLIFSMSEISQVVSMPKNECELSLFNLDRLGCLILNVSTSQAVPGNTYRAMDQGGILLTALGKALVEACMKLPPPSTSTAPPSS